MKTLNINAEKFNLPGNWNELMPDQLLRVAELSIDERPEADFKLKALLKITGLRLMERNSVLIDGMEHFYFRTPGKNVYLLNVAQINDITEYLNFMFEYVQSDIKQDRKATAGEEPNKICVLSSKLTRNLIGEVEVDGELWYGPADGITNVRTGEYIRAEMCLHKFNESKNTDHLRMLFATLWRSASEKPTSTDIRVLFDDGLVETRSKLAKDVPLKVLLAVLLFYTGCRKAIGAKFRYASNSESSGTPDRDLFMNFMRMVNGLADNDVTKQEAVRQTYLMETMITIDEMARQAEEIKKMSKKMKY